MATSDVANLIVDLRLRDNLTGGIATAKRELKGLDTQAATSTSGIGGLAGGVKTAALAFGGLAIVGGVTDLLANAAKAAADEEAGIARLTSSLKANVPAWNGNTAAIEGTIKKREDLGFSDDALRDSLGSLVAATQDVNSAFDVQNTAMDLARFKHISLQDASDALIKVEGGQYRSLKALGIVLRDGATQTEALAAVQKVAAGQAKAYGDTNAGAAEAAAVAWQDAQENLGAGLLPLVKELASVVKNDLAPALSDAGTAIGDIVHGGNDLAGILNNIVALGPQIHNSLVGSPDVSAAKAAVLAVSDLSGAQAALNAAAAAGAITQDELDAKVKNVADAQYLQAANAALAGGATNAQADAAGKAAVANDRGATAITEQAHAYAAADEAANHYTATVEAASNTSVAFTNIMDGTAGEFRIAADAALGLEDTLGSMTVGAERAKGPVMAAGDAGYYAADGFHAGADAAADYAAALAAVGRGAVPRAGDNFDTSRTGGTGQSGGMSAGDYATTQADTREKDAADAKAARDRAAADAKSARDKADREALAAAKEQARKEAEAYKTALENAFDAAKRTANSLFDTLHNRHLQAIKDAESLAEKQHAAALQAISDALKAAQAADAAPVNAAEKALRDREAAQQRRDLVEALQAAQAGTDQKAIRSATEALQNFDAAAAIDRLKGVQSGLDAAAQATANTATGKADADLAAAKAKAQADTDAETVANRKRQDDFDRALQTLREKDLKAGRSPAQQRADIAALEARFGITIDPVTGRHHITDPIVTAIKELRLTPPVFSPVLHNNFRVFIGAREVASALASGQQPAATASIRTGASGRN